MKQENLICLSNANDLSTEENQITAVAVNWSNPIICPKKKDNGEAVYRK